MNTENLTYREAGYLTRLATAAATYRRTLEKLTEEIGREQAGMAKGHRLMGISNQYLMQAATNEQALRTHLEAGDYARTATPEADWQELVRAAYTGEASIFFPN